MKAWRYRIFGSTSGELTDDWQHLEAASRESASDAPIADVANMVVPAQRIHIVLRCELGEERLELDFDGQRIGGERWL